jgi:hypothetical protein
MRTHADELIETCGADHVATLHTWLMHEREAEKLREAMSPRIDADGSTYVLVGYITDGGENEDEEGLALDVRFMVKSGRGKGHYARRNEFCSLDVWLSMPVAEKVTV